MVTEIQQSSQSLEDSATTPEQADNLQKKMEEVYGLPSSPENEGNQKPEQRRLATTGIDDKGRLVHMSNDSGTLNLDKDQLKNILSSAEGKHTIEGEDGKEFRYTRDADGVTLYTPDGNFGVRLDNEGRIVKEFSGEKQKPDLKIWDAPRSGGKPGDKSE
ncbi:MAG: hypothetical protein SFY67_05170 [Candidatus Melainabacteria bacterium]|nr:hypothetical protein [Candidatus Melainabacteria bacterium]